MQIESSLKSLAVVLPRYGANLGGGAETLVRSLIQQLSVLRDQTGKPLLPRIEVWTTCAADHRTWENFHQPGVTEDGSIVVRRFLVDKRNLEPFISAELAVQQGRPLTLDQQLEWLAEGVNSRSLYAHIATHGKEFDALLFAPYLFATTFWGAMIYPERSLLLSCLHNEAYAYLEVFRPLFHSVRGLIFNAEEEMDLARGLYGLDATTDKSSVVGMGFSASNGQGGTASAKEPISVGSTSCPKSYHPYILYSGRKETGKNLDLLIDYFSKYKNQHPSSKLELRLIGSGTIEFIDQLPAGVIDLGFVSEEEKKELISGALVLCQPSVNESFSIVMMEAWLEGVPVLVHGDCAVTKGHVVRSGGGLYFSSTGEFFGAVSELLNNSKLREDLASAGRMYVNNEYCWSAVIGRFFSAIDKVGLGREN